MLGLQRDWKHRPSWNLIQLHVGKKQAKEEIIDPGNTMSLRHRVHAKPRATISRPTLNTVLPNT